MYTISLAFSTIFGDIPTFFNLFEQMAKQGICRYLKDERKLIYKKDLRLNISEIRHFPKTAIFAG